MRTVYISKYPNPETEVVENENNIWIECKFEKLMDNIRTAQRMRPDRIIIDYESFMNNDNEDDEEFW